MPGKIPSAAALFAVLALASVAAARASTDVAGSVSGTWTLAGSPYVCLTTDLFVAVGKTLAIDPGVTVQFGPNRRLQVAGTLTASGTAASPVTFTSASPTPASGSWKQIQFLNGATATLNHVLVQGAGQGTGVAAIQAGAAVAPTGALNVSIANSAIADCASFGIAITTDGQYAHAVSISATSVHSAGKGGIDIQSATSSDSITIVGNDLTGNSGPAVQIRAQALIAFSNAAETFSGNLPGDVFSLPPFQTFSRNLNIWHNITVLPDSGAGATTVAQGVTVTVQPGVTWRMNPGQGLDVRGALNVSGTADKPVVFTGMDSAPGAWNGLWFHAGSTGTLAHTNVWYAGAGQSAAVMVDGATVSIADSEIGNCTSHGVDFTNSDVVNHSLAVSGCSIHDAAASGVRVDVILSGDAAVFANNTFARNGHDISLATACLPILNAGPDAVVGNFPGDVIWLDGGSIPDGTTLWERAAAGADLAVPAGTTVTFEPGSGLRMAGGALNVAGTIDVTGRPGSVVWLDGAAGAAGAWGGVRFAPGASGRFTSTVVADAGSGGSANLSVQGATVALNGCAVLNGSGPGISASGSVSLTVANSIVKSNLGPGIADTAGGVRTIGDVEGSGNDIVSNGAPADSAANDWQEARHNYWGADSGPYHPTLNPDGAGGTVTDHIHFLPFSGGELTLPSAVLDPISVPVKGTIALTGRAFSYLMDRWILEYGAGDPPAAYLPLMQGTNAVPGGPIASWDTAGLNVRQRYSVRLTVYDVLGRSASSVVVTPIPYGDITGNGLIEVADAVAAVRFAHGKGTPTAEQLLFGDVRPAPVPDGVITIQDAAAILKCASGLSGRLP